jgi:hypothetical protein
MFCKREDMARKEGELVPQITIGNSEAALMQLSEHMPDGLGWWVEQYCQFEVTTSPASQKVQRRDLAFFLKYMTTEERTDHRVAWTPRLSRDFQLHIQQTINAHGRRVWSDKTMIRIMAHLKTFATWVHKLRPCPLGHPMAKVKLPAVGMGLEVDRAITPAERRKLLDAADLLFTIGGLWRDRKRYKTGQRPTRKGYRPYRNRASSIPSSRQGCDARRLRSSMWTTSMAGARRSPSEKKVGTRTRTRLAAKGSTPSRSM